MPSKNKIIMGDCHEVVKDIETDSINLLYTNPPFGITNAEWDKSLNWESLWPEIWRVLKPNGAVVIHSSMPFTFDLVSSQREFFKYNYVWVKNIATGFFMADKQPLRKHEDICVFYKNPPTYNPQMIGKEFHKKRIVKHGGSEEYWGKSEHKGNWGYETEEGGHTGRFPSTVIKFNTKKSKANTEDAQTNSMEMIGFFIKTYSNENDTVLDLCSYKGDRAIMCKQLKRNYIGIEINPEFIKTTEQRLLQDLLL
mgnify:CR=1 FL=1